MKGEHKHFWNVIGEPGHRWVSDHAIIKCSCGKFSVGCRESGSAGPCQHVVARVNQIDEMTPMTLEMAQCDGCAAIVENAAEKCEWCGRNPAKEK